MIEAISQLINKIVDLPVLEKIEKKVLDKYASLTAKKEEPKKEEKTSG